MTSPVRSSNRSPALHRYTTKHGVVQAREKPNEAKIRTNADNSRKASTKRIAQTRTLNMVLLTPHTYGCEMSAQRAVVHKVLPDLINAAAAKGVTIKFSDLMGPGSENSPTQARMLPIALRAISDADLLVVLDSDHDLWVTPGEARRSRSQADAWIAETYEAALVQGFSSIRRMANVSLFGLQVKHFLAKHVDSCESCFFVRSEHHLSPTGESAQDSREQHLTDLFDDVALEVRADLFSNDRDLDWKVPGDLIDRVNALLCGIEMPAEDGSDGGSHLAHVRKQSRSFVDPDGASIKHLKEHLEGSGRSYMLLEGAVGSGKTTLLSQYAHVLGIGKAPKAPKIKSPFVHVEEEEEDGGENGGGGGVVDDADGITCYHNIAGPQRASRLHTLLRHIIGTLMEPGLERDTMTDPSVELKLLLAFLGPCIADAAKRIFPRKVTIILTGMDSIENREFCTGDHEEMELVGPRLFNAERCVFALQNLIPGDTFDRNKLIVKARRYPEQDSISTMIFDTLVDGRGVATQMIKAGQQLPKAAAQHPELQISDAETLRLGLGLVVTIVPGKYGGKNEVVVADVVDQSSAARAGIRRGDVLVECHGKLLIGVKAEVAIKLLVSSSTAHVKVETKSTGRQHTNMCGWLPKHLPDNVRFIISCNEGACKKSLLKRKDMSIFKMPRFTYGHTDKLAVSLIAEVSDVEPREDRELRKSQSLLNADQLKRLSQGYATGILDKTGNDMFLITSAGAKDVNGWFRLGKGKGGKAKKNEVSYVRRVQVENSGGADLGVPVQAKAWSSNTIARKGSKPGSIAAKIAAAGQEYNKKTNEIVLSRQPQRGWEIRREGSRLYFNGADSNQPPASYWACVDEPGSPSTSQEPPKVYNISKLAASRTPSQLARVIAEVDTTVPCPDVYIVEGAGNADCNGWYVREANEHGIKTGPFVNKNSPSGTLYSISAQKGGWCLSEMAPAGIRKIYRVNAGGLEGTNETDFPPALGWTSVRDTAPAVVSDFAAVRKSVIEGDITEDVENVAGDNDDVALPVPTTGSSSSSPVRKSRVSTRSTGSSLNFPRNSFVDSYDDMPGTPPGMEVPTAPQRGSSWVAKHGLLTAHSDVKAKVKVVSQLKAHQFEDVTRPPRVRCLVADTQLPLFLKLCTGDVMTTRRVPVGGQHHTHFHFHMNNIKTAAPAPNSAQHKSGGASSPPETKSKFDIKLGQYLDAAIGNSTGCGDVVNLIQMRLDHVNHEVVYSIPGAMRSILYLVLCSDAGMLEEELAELGMFEGGARTLEWAHVFESVKPLLICHAGRWNFAHPAIREGVYNRFTSTMIEWAYMSTLYSYFTTSAKGGELRHDGHDQPVPSLLKLLRSREELSDQSRFPPVIFKPDLEASGLKFEEVKLIGWAMQHNCTLTSLLLGGNRMGNRGARLIAAGLAKNKKLLMLNLADNSIGVDGAVAIARSLMINSTLQHLDLTKNRCQSHGAEEIGAALKQNSSLKTLLLGANFLLGEGAASIASALVTNTTLVELSLANNLFDVEGTAALSEALKLNNTLATLSLRGNALGEEGHKVFSSCLIDKTRGLTTLDLSDTQLDGKTSKIPGGETAERKTSMSWLGIGLRDNSSLLSIDVSDNSLGDEGSNLLGDMLSNVEVLHVNSHLIHINAARNGITNAGAMRFMSAIQVNGALLELDLKGNQIEPALLQDVESWLKINRKLSTLGPSLRKLERPKALKDMEIRSLAPTESVGV